MWGGGAMIWRAVRHTLFSEVVAFVLLALIAVVLAAAGVTGVSGTFLAVLGFALIVIVYHLRYGPR
jgi:heme/copper-type cytochrome/quinol oxidase subunit 4